MEKERKVGNTIITRGMVEKGHYLEGLEYPTLLKDFIKILEKESSYVVKAYDAIPESVRVDARHGYVSLEFDVWESDAAFERRIKRENLKNVKKNDKEYKKFLELRKKFEELEELPEDINE